MNPSSTSHANTNADVMREQGFNNKDGCSITSNHRKTGVNGV